MALFSNNISRLFENNPVNQVGPTGQPLIGGSTITDLGARSLGGLLGREVRGRPEQLTAALAQIDPKAPDAEQQQLTILAQLGSPQQQVMAAQKIKANREKAEEKSLAERQIDGYNSIATLARTSSADPEFLNNVSRIANELRLDPTKVNELIKSNTTGIKTVTVADGSEVVRVNNDGTVTKVFSNEKELTPAQRTAANERLKEEKAAISFKKFLPLYRLSDAEEEAISDSIDSGSIKTIDALYSSIAKFDSSAGGMKGETITQLAKYQEAETDAGGKRNSVSGLINKIETVQDLGAGLPVAVGETVKELFGTRDAPSEIRTEFNRTVTEGIISGLPPGVASDKDIELLKGGFPPATAGKQEMLNYLNAYQRTLAGVEKYSSFKSKFVSNNKTIANVNTAAEGYRKSSRDASTVITGILNGTAPGTQNMTDAEKAKEVEIIINDFNGKIGTTLNSDYSSDFVTPLMLDSIRGNPAIEALYSSEFQRNYLMSN
jgi:hypothetical protein